MRGAVAPHGVQIILRVGTIEGFLPIDPRFQHVRIDAQRIGVQDHKIRILPRRERANPIGQVQHLGPGDRQRLDAALRDMPARTPRAAIRRRWANP